MKKYNYLDINSINEDYLRFAYYLEIVKETSKSIYAKSQVYGWVYRIEKGTGKIFKDGKQIAETCTYFCYN